MEAPGLVLSLKNRSTSCSASYASWKSKQKKTPEIEDSIRKTRRAIADLTAKIYENLTPWQIVQVARHKNRPHTADYLSLVFDEFVELHGDKLFGDDAALRTGFAKLDQFKVMVIGHQKGRTTKERTACYFGCAHPEGYRKALAKMRLAAKFGLPVICFIDTPGAYPGIGAEERGQALAIAENMFEMSRLKTPIICVVIGEGGSGGALGIGVGDRVAMLQNAYYSVISPEGCAGILWKSHEYAANAAAALEVHIAGSAPIRCRRRRDRRTAGRCSPGSPSDCLAPEDVSHEDSSRAADHSCRRTGPPAVRKVSSAWECFSKTQRQYQATRSAAGERVRQGPQSIDIPFPQNHTATSDNVSYVRLGCRFSSRLSDSWFSHLLLPCRRPSQRKVI